MELLALASIVFILAISSLAVKRKREKKAREQYYQTDYAFQTHNSYEQMMSDEGLLGEFSIYKALQSLEGPKKIPF